MISESTPIKIVILLPSLKFGGAERVALSLLNEFKANSCRVEIILMSKIGEFLVEAETHVSVIDLQCHKLYQLPFKLISYLWKNPTDVLISSFWKLNLCACVTKLLFPTLKLILWEHAEPSKSTRIPRSVYALTASIFYRLADKVIVVSTGVYQDICRLTLGLKHKLKIIYNPIPPPKANLGANSGLIKSGSKLVISVGRLDSPKNPQILLEAFVLISSTCNVILAYVGDGVFRYELEQRALALGLQGRVMFLGYHKNPYEIMLDADLLVLSSDSEGFGNVIVEAMHCGLRVVSTDCGRGIWDILLDNYYGTIVARGDKFTLAKAIEAELACSYSAETQKNGAARFLPEVAALKFLDIIRNTPGCG